MPWFPSCASSFPRCFCSTLQTSISLHWSLDLGLLHRQFLPLKWCQPEAGTEPCKTWSRCFMPCQLRWRLRWLREEIHPAFSGKLKMGGMAKRKPFGRSGANTHYKSLTTTELTVWVCFFGIFIVPALCLANKSDCQHQWVKSAGSCLFSRYLPWFPSFRNAWLLQSVVSHG